MTSRADIPALEARGLTLAWDDGAPVVEGVDIVVGAGETVCLVGKSGMGKTTLLHALAGLTVPRAGRVLLHGEDVTGQPGRISYMLQKDLLLPNLTVIDNACLPLTLAGTPKREAREKARPLLERFGLEDAADKWPSQLSGGMRQRAAFARTCLMGNDVVMLDEPFSALDAITRVDLRSWFRAEAGEMGLSTLMITHDADEACTMADRIYVLGPLPLLFPAGNRFPAGNSVGGAPGGAERGVEGAAKGALEVAPAGIVGEVVPDRSMLEPGADFSCTGEYLDAKQRVLEMLR